MKKEGAMRVGIVGAGVIGHRLAKSFAEINGPKSISAVCDVNRTNALQLLRAYNPEGSTCEDFNELCARDDVDIVYVGVPPSKHCDVAVTALKSGKHVLCEKPLALSDVETQLMVDAAASCGSCVTAVNFPFRYTPAVHEFKRRIDSGSLGTLHRINITFRFPEWPRSWQKSKWLEGSFEGGPLREVGSHFFFLLLELFGPVKRVRANVKYPDAGKSLAENEAWGTIELVNGLQCGIDLLTGIAAPEENSFTAFGTDGSLSLVNWSVLIGVSMKGVVEDGACKLEKINVGARDTRRAETILVEEFSRAIQAKHAGQPTQTTSLVSFTMAAETNRILNAIFASKDEWIPM